MNFGLFLAIVLIFVAEGLNILGEMYAAQLNGAGSLLEVKNIKLFAMVMTGAAMLLFAYTLGYGATKNIWVISAAAVTSILIIEPVLAWYFFHQLPTKGALLALVLGAIGFLVTIFWK